MMIETDGPGGAEIIVLQRIGDVPWDADPEEEPGLTLYEDGTFEDGLLPLGAQADRIQWRVWQVAKGLLASAVRNLPTLPKVCMATLAWHIR